VLYTAGSPVKRWREYLTVHEKIEIHLKIPVPINDTLGERVVSKEVMNMKVFKKRWNPLFLVTVSLAVMVLVLVRCPDP
jgi:hypothetical protein